MTKRQNLENTDRPAGEAAKLASLDLKALRETRGITLREIYEQTRITVVNLEAIETQNFHLLPSPAYAKTFIRGYADAIGMESKIIQEAYDQYLHALHAEQEQGKDHGNNRRKGKNKRILVWTVLLTIAAGAVLLALFLLYGSDPEIPRTESDKTTLKKTDAATVEATRPVDAPVPPGQADPARPETKADGTPFMTGQNPAQAGRDLQAGMQTGVAPPPATVSGPPVSSENRQTAEPR